MFFWSKSVQCGTIEACNVRTLVKTNVAVISLFQICHNITERQRTPSRSLEYKLTCNAFFDAVFVKFFFFIQKLGNSGKIDATCLSSDGERWFRTINLRHFKLAKCRPLPKKKNYLFKFFIKIYKIKKEKQRQKYLCIVWATLACYYIHVHVWSIILLYETSPFCTVSFKSVGMLIDWTFKFAPL